MKGNTFILAIIIAALSCAQRKNEVPTIGSVDSISVMSKQFQAELDKLIEKVNSDDNSVLPNPTVIVVVIDTLRAACVLRMAPAMYYFGDKLKGYFVYRDFLIAFYRRNSPCYESVVDFRKMHVDPPSGFPNENSSFETSITYEPWGRRYTIRENGELEMTFEGYF